jgi:DNA primase
MSGQSFPKVQKLLSGMIGDFTKDRPTGKLVLPEGIKPMTPRHRHYLKKRGFDPDEMEKVWHLQGIGMAAKLSWRLFIPITLKGKVVSWTTRSLDPQVRMKYIGASSECESVPKRDLLYGEDYASPHSVICVEGPADVWAIGPGAVATLGIAYSQSQLMKLSRYTNRYIVYDAEERAQEKARQLCSDLKVFSGNTYNVVMDSKDPGEASRKEINQLRRLLK